MTIDEAIASLQKEWERSVGDCSYQNPQKLDREYALDHALQALREKQERDEDDEIIETPEACTFCWFYDEERALCMNRDSPCCGQWIKEIMFGCNLFEPSEQAVGRNEQTNEK